ncbi:hypothetical protein AGMMS49975_16630 [Clostridia bacterium]|nr:hypothetical protein AGMMS49975_16630 [Clostridia bacterium]
MKLYGVCIGSYVSEDGFAFFTCNNKTEARKLGNQYRKAWEITDPIVKIVEIPESIRDDNEERRKYAVISA